MSMFNAMLAKNRIQKARKNDLLWETKDLWFPLEENPKDLRPIALISDWSKIAERLFIGLRADWKSSSVL